MTTFISPQALSVYETVPATGVAAYAWLLILIPLASAGLLLLLGRASDKWGHLLATLASWSTFAVGALIAAQMWNAPWRRAASARRCSPGSPPVTSPSTSVSSWTAVDHVRHPGDLRRVAHPRVRDCLHGARRGPPPFLRLPELLHRGDADPGARGLLRRPLRRLGRRGPGVLPADRLLEPRARIRGRSQEGVRHEPCR